MVGRTTSGQRVWAAGRGAVQALVVAWIGASLGACGAESRDTDPLEFTNIHEGDYLGGLQISTLAVTGPQIVERTELYLDRARIAADEFAPFELTWDARVFPEGRHELMARADLDDGTQLHRVIEIQIDNTPPSVGDLPASATVGEAFVVPASDNGKVTRVEVARTGANESITVLTTAPYSTGWRWGCGPVALTIRVVDAAGAVTEKMALVNGIDPKDLDCDQHLALRFGGDDCNDADPNVHPSAPEQQDLIDRNCNGIAGFFDGVDNDHDGVPSIASGGTDCDDSNPSIHGGLIAFDDELVTANGQPVTWAPGEASFSNGYISSGDLFLSRAGVVERVVFDRSTTIEQIATHANPGSIAGVDDNVVFGRDNHVVLMTRDSSQHWNVRADIDAGAPVGRLAYVRDLDGSADHIVVQAGTKVWFASNATGAWVTQLLVDAGEPLANAPVLLSGFSSLYYAFMTSHAAWSGSAFPGEPAPSAFTDRAGPAGATPTAVEIDSIFPLVAVTQGDDGAVYQGASTTPVVTTRGHIRAMFFRFPTLYVQTENGDTQVFNAARGYHRRSAVIGIGSFDIAAFDTFAGNGHIYRRDPRSVNFADETDDDGIDSNCDGFDD